jgi:hypothetical protein
VTMVPISTWRLPSTNNRKNSTAFRQSKSLLICYNDSQLLAHRNQKRRWRSNDMFHFYLVKGHTKTAFPRLLFNCGLYQEPSESVLSTHKSPFKYRLYHRFVGSRKIISIFTFAPFPRTGKYPQVTNVCHIYQLWERGWV